MSEVQYELVSASNYSQGIMQAFHKPTRSLIGWESTDFAVPPIEILFKLEALTFVTQLYLSPKKNKHVRMLEVLISQDSQQFSSLAKVYDLNDAVRVEVSGKCRYIKLAVMDKPQGSPASIDILRIYGHPYFKYHEDRLFHTQKAQRVDEVLMGYGFNPQYNWQVDHDTLVTLHDMSKLQSESASRGDRHALHNIQKDLKAVLKIGQAIKTLQNQLQFISARSQFDKLKECQDQIRALSQQRDHYDEKYQTSRFEAMIALNDHDNKYDQVLRDLLLDDKEKLEEERRRREQEAHERERQLAEEFQQLQDQEQWWNQQHQLDQLQQPEDKKPTVQNSPKHSPQPQHDYKFKNPYVYNQGDADMEKYIRPLLNEFGGHYTADPELLRKYQQLQYLDVLGARIWISAHSQNWRQRAAAVEAVLRFSQDKLPQRYNQGKTRNLFRALMEFARINAQDKVLQIYYTSLRIMTKALQPPICGEDVPPVLLNKELHKFMAILIDKISEMNARAKEISLKQLITVFKHPAADLHIAVNEALRVCKEELNLKFVPVDKQNPRIVLSRLEIIAQLMGEFNFQKRKIDYGEILRVLVEGALYHSSNEIRTYAVKTLGQIYKANPQVTIDWYRSIKGLRPNIAAELQQKLNLA